MNPLSVGFIQRLGLVRTIKQIDVGKINNIRYISMGRIINTEFSKEEKEKFSKISREIRVSDFEKKLLVWSGHFKRVEDVPRRVNASTVDKSKNYARMKVATMMMLGTIVLCIIVIIYGKRRLEKGETMETINEAYKKELMERFKKKE